VTDALVVVMNSGKPEGAKGSNGLVIKSFTTKIGKMELFKTEELRGKTQPITYKQVAEAYRKVRSNGGAAGIDGETLEMLTERKVDNLYKLWNRMASGSYMPKGVRGVEIPKQDGTKRLLGIPTVTDRIAQEVAKAALEPKMESVFHADSYGYRPNRSAHDAVRKCQQRCYEYRWVIDIDIKGFFDNIDHDLMMQVVSHYTKEKWLLLYIQRWLKCSMHLPDGTIQQRSKGTPQGGVISPLLANMFLHVVFDAWMQRHYADTQYGSIRWERYADDIIVHCKNENEAKYILNQIKKRMKECKLELHPDKTKIVYCKQSNRRAKNENVVFTFLGFEFRPERMKGKTGETWVGYTARISRKAMKHIVTEIKKYNIHRSTGKELSGIAQRLDSQLRGWIQYFSKFRPSALQEVFSVLNDRLVHWYTNKYKRYRRRKKLAREKLKEICKDFPNLFVHWQYGYTP